MKNSVILLSFVLLPSIVQANSFYHKGSWTLDKVMCLNTGDIVDQSRLPQIQLHINNNEFKFVEAKSDYSISSSYSFVNSKSFSSAGGDTKTPLNENASLESKTFEHVEFEFSGSGGEKPDIRRDDKVNRHLVLGEGGYVKQLFFSKKTIYKKPRREYDRIVFVKDHDPFLDKEFQLCDSRQQVHYTFKALGE